MPTMKNTGKRQDLTSGLIGIAVMVAGLLLVGAPGALAQQTSSVPATTPAAEHATPPAQTTQTPTAASAPQSHATPAGAHATPAGDHAPAQSADHGAAASHAAEGEHGESILVTLARVANFAILAGIIYWFARKPLAEHLASRRAQIRKDLVDAAEMRTTAAARLADIEARLAALPGELEQLRTRSAEELEAEKGRIRAAAEVERDRLVEQARREINAQTRNARTALRAHAATLAVDVAEARLRATLTAAEQSALVDRYASQMRNVQ
jgi:F-type H+-transporting ATPase subunit b